MKPLRAALFAAGLIWPLISHAADYILDPFITNVPAGEVVTVTLKSPAMSEAFTCTSSNGDIAWVYGKLPRYSSEAVLTVIGRAPGTIHIQCLGPSPAGNTWRDADGIVAVTERAAPPPYTAPSRRRATRSEPIDFSRILWIGAHPDDESLIAPLLGTYCAELGHPCASVILTHGENGECTAPEICAGRSMWDLRGKEAQAAAALLGYRLYLWSYPDAFSDVASVWATSAGARETLVSRLREVIVRETPSVIITFDPRHGSSCHPAHMETGRLVVDAARDLHLPVWMVETQVRFDGRYSINAMVSSPLAFTFVPGMAWGWTIADMRSQPTQFPTAVVDAIWTIPVEDRKVVLLPAEASDAVSYSASCP